MKQPNKKHESEEIQDTKIMAYCLYCKAYPMSVYHTTKLHATQDTHDEIEPIQSVLRMLAQTEHNDTLSISYLLILVLLNHAPNETRHPVGR